MLEAFDLTGRIPKGQYSSTVEPLEARAAELQRLVRRHGKSVIIVMEGWRGSGITRIINMLQPVLDPRGTRIHPIAEPNDIERDHGMFWRFWSRLPPYGQTAIFDRSWYTSTIVEHYNPDQMDEIPASCIEDINNFEAQIISDGDLLLKFFLHISKEEQKRRLIVIKDSPFTMQARYLLQKEGIYMVNRTSYDYHAVKTDIPTSGQCRRIDEVWLCEFYRHSTLRWSAAYGKEGEKGRQRPTCQDDHRTEGQQFFKNRSFKGYSHKEYKPILQNLGKNSPRHETRFIKLKFCGHRFEGWDAARKGGCIIRLAESFNQGYVVDVDPK